MNKKFSTLVAGLILASSFGAYAQVNVNAQLGHFPKTPGVLTDVSRAHGVTHGSGYVFRSENTKVQFPGVPITPAVGSRLISDVIKADSLYLLSDATGANVLTMQRNEQTGDVYLALKPVASAPMNASLWKIEVIQDASSVSYRYINKEMNLPLSVDYSAATVIAAGATQITYADLTNNATLVEENKNDNWDWYSSRNFTAGGQLPAVSITNTLNSIADVYTFVTPTGRVVDNGLLYLVNHPVANSAYVGAGLAEVQLQVCSAASIVLTANDLNQMVDFQEMAGRASFASTTTPTAVSPFLNGAFRAVQNQGVAGGVPANASGVVANAYYDATTAANEYVWLKAGNWNGEQVPPTADNGANFLMVDTAFFPNSSKELMLTVKGNPYRAMAVDDLAGVVGGNFNQMTNESLTNRYLFKFTYFPTQDSLAIEPRNAMRMSDLDIAAGTFWREMTNSAYSFNSDDNDMADLWTSNPYAPAVAGTPKNATLGQVMVRLAYLTGSQSVITAKNTEVLGSTGVPLPGSLLTRFTFANRSNSFEYLERISVADSLYFLNIAGMNDDLVTGVRENGMYIANNMIGNLMYDAPKSNQNFELMPATQWVVEQLGGDGLVNPRVRITNREYANTVFTGQLYKAGSGNVYFIDHANYAVGYNRNISGVEPGKFQAQLLRCQDTLQFNAIITPTVNPVVMSANHGYHIAELPTSTVEKNFTLQYNGYPNRDDLYLSCSKDTAVVMPVKEGVATMFELEVAGTNRFGYGGGVAGLQNLNRAAYRLKVKDENLIDDNQKYIALVKEVSGRFSYKAVRKSEINGETVKVAEFYLKADQYKDVNGAEVPAYVLVDVLNFWNPASTITANEWFDNDNARRPVNGYVKAQVINGWTLNGYGKLKDEGLNDNPDSNNDAFILSEATPRNLYFSVEELQDLSGEDNLDLKKAAKLYIYNESTVANPEYLYEDAQDAKGILANKGLSWKTDVYNSFLGMESKGINANAALNIEDANGSEFMPKYLFSVAADTVQAGFLCKDVNHRHGYYATAAEAEAVGDHTDPYLAYTAGRYLVNLNDSALVHDNLNEFSESSKFKYGSYIRLGFVEAVHQGNTLYVLNGKVTLKEMSTIKDNSKADHKVIDMDVLKANSNAITLDAAHNNCSFSFRKVDDSSQTDDRFMIESQSYYANAAAGSWTTNAWLQVKAGVPVLAQVTPTHTHNAGQADINEGINQADVFRFTPTDEVATSTDPIEVSAVSIIAGNGSVRIVGGAGKTVSITNILGQVVANEVITSDDATISVPKGIVVVTVEGEKAVKAIIK